MSGDQQSIFQQSKCEKSLSSYAMSKMKLYCIILMLGLCAKLCGAPPVAAQIESNVKRVHASASEKTGEKANGQFDRLLGPDEKLSLYVSSNESAFELVDNGETFLGNYGNSEIKNGELLIQWRQPLELITGVGSEYVIVQWSDCVFLVDKSELPRFCRRAKSNRNTVKQLYLWKCDAAVDELRGSPKIPDKFAIYWDLESIDAKVIQAEKVERVESSQQRTFMQKIVLDKGKLDHVYEGMKMQTVAIPSLELIIVEVRDESSVGIIKHVGRKPRIRVGAIFTTDF